MRIFYVCLLIASLPFSLFSQLKHKPVDASLSAGLSLPHSSFAQTKNFGDHGFAKPGINLAGDISVYYWKILGAGFSLHSSLNGMDEPKLQQWYNTRLYQKEGVSVTAGNYSVNTAILYPLFFDFRKAQFGAQLKAGLGISVCSFPNVSVMDATYGQILEIKNNWDAAATSAAYARFYYQVNEKLVVMLSYGRYNLIPSFTGSNNDRFNQNMFHQTLNLGYVFTF
jgi:hypothetical protein